MKFCANMYHDNGNKNPSCH